MDNFDIENILRYGHCVQPNGHNFTRNLHSHNRLHHITFGGLRSNKSVTGRLFSHGANTTKTANQACQQRLPRLRQGLNTRPVFFPHTRIRPNRQNGKQRHLTPRSMTNRHRRIVSPPSFTNNVTLRTDPNVNFTRPTAIISRFGATPARVRRPCNGTNHTNVCYIFGRLFSHANQAFRRFTHHSLISNIQVRRPGTSNQFNQAFTPLRRHRVYRQFPVEHPRV